MANVSASARRLWWYSFACAAGFAWLAYLAVRHKLGPFNAAVIRTVQGWESAWLTPVMKFFTFIGSGWPVVVLAVAIVFILYQFLHHRRALILFLVVVIGSSLLNTLLKAAFRLPRPTVHRLVEITGYGFPSGHAMGAFSLYGVTAYLLWKHTPGRGGRMAIFLAAALLILAIGLSRIYLGVHFPSDVIGGYLAAASWMFACISLYQRFFERRMNASTAKS